MAGDREYHIKHALTREVAYATLPKARRARLHAAFAEWLEEAVEARDEMASLLAHHYAEAVRPEDADLAWASEEQGFARLRARAASWLRRAGELALGRYELDDAIGLLRRALEVEEDGPTQAAIWRSIGSAHAMQYEGDAFWEAMDRSLEVCYDRPTCADTYSMLAFQTLMRMGMWKQHPDPELVRGWIERALDMAPAESRARARALISRALLSEEDDEAGREGAELAERLDDPELRSYALEARSATALYHRRYDEAWTWAQRRFDLIDRIDDPDHLMDMHEGSIPACAAVGRFKEARHLARAADELSAKLSPHHRVHGVSLRLEVEELAGGWEAIRGLAARVEGAVAANLDTPCVRNPRSLLVVAVAAEEAGDHDRAVQLEQAADRLGMEGYDFPLEPPRVRLAMLRGNLDRVGELLDTTPGHSLNFGLATWASRLDALAAMRDRERAEGEAEKFLRSGTYLEPFALRALGVVREDQELLARALERFRALGLDWHAEQTEILAQ